MPTSWCERDEAIDATQSVTLLRWHLLGWHFLRWHVLERCVSGRQYRLGCFEPPAPPRHRSCCFLPSCDLAARGPARCCLPAPGPARCCFLPSCSLTARGPACC